MRRRIRPIYGPLFSTINRKLARNN